MQPYDLAEFTKIGKDYRKWLPSKWNIIKLALNFKQFPWIQAKKSKTFVISRRKIKQKFENPSFLDKTSD